MNYRKRNPKAMLPRGAQTSRQAQEGRRKAEEAAARRREQYRREEAEKRAQRGRADHA